MSITIAGAYLYIANLDWNKHKNIIAEQFFEATGKKIVFQGPVSFSLLPTPILKASNVNIINPNADPRSEPLMSIKSLDTELNLWALMSGKFEVAIMTLSEPNILVEKDDDGNINWLLGIDDTTYSKLEEAKLSFHSLVLRNASLAFVDTFTLQKIQLTNLNAEVIAQSLLGPFDVDGSYIKDNNPEGFSIKLGKLSNRFATTISFNLSHPASQTSVRFDGSFLTENKSFNGDVVFSSEKLRNFVNANFKAFQLAEIYDYPLIFNFELKSNQEKTTVSNFVFEYGESKGAGSLLVPHQPENEEKKRTKVEAALSLTDFNPTPVLAFLKNLLNEKSFVPLLDFDLISDFKALKTTYNNEIVKDLVFGLDIVDNNFQIKDLSATLPGDSTFQTNGEFFSQKDLLTYAFTTELNSQDLEFLLNWLNLKTEVVVPGTYKKATLSTLIEGNAEKIKLGDFKALIDKTTLSGNFGIVLGDRPNIWASFDVDVINFDNYFKPLSEEEQKNDLASKMALKFSKLKLLNDFDMQINAKIGLAIFEANPYEKLNLMANLNQGQLDVAELSIREFANAAILASGTIKGFGVAPIFENLKYQLQTQNLEAFANKMGLSYINLDYKNNKNLDVQGIVTGEINNFNTKSVLKLDKLDAIYSGKIFKKDAKTLYAGEINLKSIDFLASLKAFKVDYNPTSFSLGILALKSKIQGEGNHFKLTELLANIGSNSFEGDLEYYLVANRPNIKANLKINTMETERFFYNKNKNKDNKNTFNTSASDKNTFIKKPFFDDGIIDYDFYKKFNLYAKLNFEKLFVFKQELKDARLDIKLENAVADITNFRANYKEGSVGVDFKYEMLDAPKIKGKFSLENQIINPAFASGSVYGLTQGSFGVKDAQFETDATSFATMFDNLSAEINFDADKVIFKGFDLAKIREDLIKREASTGLIAFVTQNLAKGQISLAKFVANFKLEKGKWKLNDINLKTNDEDINVNADGDLKNWSLQANFGVKYPNYIYLPSFSFSLEDSLNNPKLSVNVDELVKMYDDRQEEFAEQRKKLQQEKITKIQNQMSSIQNIAKSFSVELLNLQTDAKNKKAEASTNDIKNQYNKLEDKLEKIAVDIENIELADKKPEKTDALLNQLEEKNLQIRKNLQEVNKTIESVYLQDIKNKILQKYSKIDDIYNQSKMQARKYKSSFAEIEKKFLTIQTEYILSSDKALIQKNKDVEKYVLQIDEIHNKVTIEYNNIKNSDNTIIIEDFNKKLSLELDAGDDNLKYLNSSMTDALAYAESIWQRENKNWLEKKRLEEMARKIKENTGSLSVVDKGINLTIKKDIEVIEQNQEKMEAEKLRVLDFSKKTTKNISNNKTPNKGIIKKQ